MPANTSAEASFRVFYNTFSGRLHSYCKSRLDRDDARDITTEVLMEIWDRRQEYADPQHLERVLFLTARHRMIDKYRKMKSLRKVVMESSMDPNLPDTDQCSENQLAFKMTMESVYEKIETLPPRCKAVIHLHLEHQSVPEIAESLSMAPTTVYMHLKSGKEKIRELISACLF